MSTQANQPAFPVIESESSYIYGHDQSESVPVVAEVRSVGGLSKRELFAAMAMQGAVSNPEMIPRKETMGDHARGWIAAADALLAELEKEKAHE